MSFEGELTTYLKAHVALVNQGVYPLRLPEGCALPALTYQVMTGRELHLANYVEPSIMLTSWSKDHAAVIAVDDQVRDALEGFHGMMGAVHVRCQVGAPSDTHEPDTGLYSRRREARPLYRHP